MPIRNPYAKGWEEAKTARIPADIDIDIDIDFEGEGERWRWCANGHDVPGY